MALFCSICKNNINDSLIVTFIPYICKKCSTSGIAHPVVEEPIKLSDEPTFEPQQGEMINDRDGIQGKPVYFRFEIKQNVVISALRISARVFARCDRGNDIRNYRVIYWWDGKRYDDWVFENELKEV